jgi:hypothetical protein
LCQYPTIRSTPRPSTPVRACWRGCGIPNPKIRPCRPKPTGTCASTRTTRRQEKPERDCPSSTRASNPLRPSLTCSPMPSLDYSRNVCSRSAPRVAVGASFVTGLAPPPTINQRAARTPCYPPVYMPGATPRRSRRGSAFRGVQHNSDLNASSWFNRDSRTKSPARFTVRLRHQKSVLHQESFT